MTSAVIAVLAVSCDKTEPVEPDDPKTPDPELSLQESIEVPADGGVFSITYTIENQNDSLSVEASSESNEWIHSFDCSVPGTISFTVDEYTDETQSREAAVDVVYGDITGQFTVIQTASEPYFVIGISDIDYSTFVVNVTPRDKEMTYTALVTEKEFYSQFETDEEVIEYITWAWQEEAEGNNIPIDRDLDTMLETGDLTDMTVSNRLPGTDYVVFAFGINYDLEALTGVYTSEVTTKTVELLDISYELTPDVNGADAIINIVPSDLEQSYYAGVVEKSQLAEAGTVEYWQDYFIEQIKLNQLLYGMSAEETMSPNIHTGEQDIEFSLSPETEYAAVAMAASLQGIVFSEVSTAEFKTNKANLSDNKISIDVEIIDSYTYWFKISTTNSDPYTWGCQPSSKYEGMSDEEMLEYLLQDPFIGLNVRSGDVESNMGATPGNTYTLYAFGYANGTATTDLKHVEFTMPEE